MISDFDGAEQASGKPANDRTASFADGIADKENIHLEKKNPTVGVWHHLFEPVYTGGHPIHALGDLGTREG